VGGGKTRDAMGVTSLDESASQAASGNGNYAADSLEPKVHAR